MDDSAACHERSHVVDSSTAFTSWQASDRRRVDSEPLRRQRPRQFHSLMQDPGHFVDTATVTATFDNAHRLLTGDVPELLGAMAHAPIPGFDSFFQGPAGLRSDMEAENFRNPHKCFPVATLKVDRASFNTEVFGRTRGLVNILTNAASVHPIRTSSNGQRSPRSRDRSHTEESHIHSSTSCNSVHGEYICTR